MSVTIPMPVSFLFLGLLLSAGATFAGEAPSTTPPPAEPLRLGIAGLVHGHVYGFLYDACGRADVDLVGIAEPREGLLRREKERHKLADDVLFTDLEKMLDTARPQAVAVFTDTLGHLEVVQACAERSIHVMMEKPLAVSMEHARAMEQAAERSGIHVLVNYETTWYPNTQAVIEIVHRQKRLGDVRRVVACTGHRGPKEIGMPSEFMEWLTDPERNGGGALYDFGCYGANIMTCLMGEQRPLRVTCVTQQLKSDSTYARVDDEATIVLTYPLAQAVIQASWNWPYNRKDMEIYGERGYLLTVDREAYRLRVAQDGEKQVRAPQVDAPQTDPITYLTAVARGDLAPSGPSSLEVNVIVAEILDAARRSAREGRAIALDPDSSSEP